MSTFAQQVKAWTVKVDVRTRGVFVGTATKVHESIKTGSALTGAPGQPVDTGDLRNSWILNIEPEYAEVQTNVVYAPNIEYGVGPHGPLTLRSAVGGFHSVKLTVAGANRLQAAALAELGP